MLGIFLDTETNGLNAQKHMVIEIAFQILDIMNGEVKDSYQSLVSISAEDWKKSDPESLKINGFTWEETLKGISASDAGLQIQEKFIKNGIRRGEAVFICQNPSFDRVFFSKLIDVDVQEKLFWPYHWLDLASMYWAKSIQRAASGHGSYPWETGVSKDKIALAYHLPKEEQPHRAMNGVKHLLLCYQSVVGFPNSSK